MLHATALNKTFNLTWAENNENVQVMLAREVVVVEQKKAATQALIASIGQEKTVVDEAVNSSRADEEEAAALSVQFAFSTCLLPGRESDCYITSIQCIAD